jgi:hypothetical protein
LVAASADAGAANLEWQVNVPAVVTIERTRSGGLWDRLASVTPDGAAASAIGTRTPVPEPAGDIACGW